MFLNRFGSFFFVFDSQNHFCSVFVGSFQIPAVETDHAVIGSDAYHREFIERRIRVPFAVETRHLIIYVKLRLVESRIVFASLSPPEQAYSEGSDDRKVIEFHSIFGETVALDAAAVRISLIRGDSILTPTSQTYFSLRVRL